MSTTTNYADLPLCTSPLTAEEARRLQDNLEPLMRFLGSPGDWGYQTKLGRLTCVLLDLRAEITKASNDAAREAERDFLLSALGRIQETTKDSHPVAYGIAEHAIECTRRDGDCRV